jgi:hypothetical protein
MLEPYEMKAAHYSSQSNSYLFTCKLNSPEANYKVNASKRKKQQQKNTNKIKNKAVNITIIIVIIIIPLKIYVIIKR